MNDKIELDRFGNNDFIMGKCIKETDDKITLKDPRLIIMAPTSTGEMGVLIKPVCYPFTSPRLSMEMEF